MKKFSIPTISNVFKRAFEAFMRFPFAVLISVIGSISACLLFSSFNSYLEKYTHIYQATLLTSALALPLMVAAQLFIKTTRISTGFGGLIKLGILGIMALYYLSIPEEIKQNNILQFFLFNFVAHLLVAFSPFISNKKVTAFWQFNRILFINLITTLIYIGVLTVGLLLAILTVDKLFDLNFHNKIYAYFFFIMAGIVHTVFFLEKIPENTQELEELDEYPKELTFFTQYILLPLVSIYLVILYIYLGKIIMSWSLPRGWVSYLVLGVSILGTLSYLLVWPIRHGESFRWVKAFSKWFFILLIPLVVLLSLSIYTRIKDYGITENRYLVLITSIWLVGMIVYFISSKKQNIKTIPLTLAILMFIASLGPLSAFKIAEWSQLGRWEKILNKYSLLQNGYITKATSENKMDFNDQKQLSEIVTFFHKRKNMEVFRPYFNTPLMYDSTYISFDSVLTKGYQADEELMKLLNIKFIPEWQTKPQELDHISFYVSKEPIIDISQFDYLIQLESEYQYKSFIKSKKPYFAYSKDNEVILVDKNENVIFNIDLEQHFEELSKKYSKETYSNNNVTLGEMTITQENKKYMLKLIVYDMYTTISKEGSRAVVASNAELYLKIKK